MLGCMKRQAYPSDVTDEEWAFIRPYLTLMREDAPQREHDLREVFNGLRWIVKTGSQWRMMPHDLPPWYTVYQQTQRWVNAGVFEAMIADLRAILRQMEGKDAEPSAAILDGRTLQSTPESGERAGYDGYKRKKGSKVHLAVDTLGNLLALRITAANEQERSQVGELLTDAQSATGNSIEVAFADQGYTGEQAAQDAQQAGVELVVVKLSEAKKGFVLLPKRWVVERSFAWLTRFRRLIRDYERTAEMLRGLHYVAFAILMLQRLARLILPAQSA